MIAVFRECVVKLRIVRSVSFVCSGAVRDPGPVANDHLKIVVTLTGCQTLCKGGSGPFAQAPGTLLDPDRSFPDWRPRMGDEVTSIRSGFLIKAHRLLRLRRYEKMSSVHTTKRIVALSLLLSLQGCVSARLAQFSGFSQ